MADAITNNRWIADIDHNLNQQLIMEYFRLWEELDNIELIETQDDRKTPITITWILTADGKYTAKSAYSMQFEGKTKCVAAAQTWKTKACTTKMQVLHMAHVEGQNMDCSAFATQRMAK